MLPDMSPRVTQSPGIQHHAFGLQMAVEGQDRAAIREDVPHDDRALIDAPAQRLRIQDRAMPDAVDGPAQTIAVIVDPIFAGMNAGVAFAVAAK